MGYNVGMPVIKLDRNNHFGKQDKHSGNAYAVACEGLSERFSSDTDVNKSMTERNYYFDYAFTSGKDLSTYWNQMADDYKVVDKNGKERKLRSDAGIGFAGICKPEKDFMDSLDEDEIKQFMNDSLEVIRGIYEKRGCIIDSAVVHYDEGNPHMHYYGHDPDYKLGKKLGLPLYTALNQTEYPEQMRQRGWEIDNLVGYKEITSDMTKEEKEAYKEKCRNNRGKHGVSSAEYKAGKKAEQIISDAQIQAKTITVDTNVEIKRLKREAEKEIREKEKKVDERESTLRIRENDLKVREDDLKNKMIESEAEKEKALEMQNTTLKMQQEVEDEKEKALEMQNKALKMQREAEAEKKKALELQQQLQVVASRRNREVGGRSHDSWQAELSKSGEVDTKSLLSRR